MKTAMQELIEEIKDCTLINSNPFIKPAIDLIVNMAEEKLEKEKQDKKQECIEFSKYIRNGKDHFNNGYSTEMVYDEWIEKSKLQRE